MTPVRNDLRRDQCPVCGLSTITQLGDVPAATGLAYSTHTLELEHAPEIWFCRKCASWFKQNAVTADSARSLYETGSSGERWIAEPFERAKCPELLAEFDRHVNVGTRILDIGCSDGLLLDYAKSRGAETWGVDYSAACGEILLQKGHRFGATLSDVGGERFDVATAFDVVEHVYELPDFFSSVARLLKPGGRLLILTGNVGSLAARLCGSKWWYLRFPEHIVFPSHRFFRSRPAGLRLLRTVRTHASVGYRMPLMRALRRTVSMLVRGTYEGLPALGPDHFLIVLGRD
jgi:SAM-dependent methyltransferase